MCEYSAWIYIYMHRMYAWCLQSSEDELQIDGCERPCQCWKMNTGSPQEQQMLLSAQSSFQLPSLGFIIYKIPSIQRIKNGVLLWEFSDMNL